MDFLKSVALAACFTLVPATNRGAVPLDPFRLTREVEPFAQAVTLALDPAKDDYTGSVRINLTVHSPVSSFRLHALGLAMSTITVTDRDRRVIPLMSAVSDGELGLVTLTAPMPLALGEHLLEIAFTGKLRRDGRGIYKTMSRGDTYLFSQFWARDARMAFPCWDDPGFKIPWQLNLTLPAALEVASNVPAAQETRTGGVKTLAFGRTPPMPSYLVAFAVGPLEFVPVPGLPVPGRIITPRGQSGLAVDAARLSPALLSRLEAYFGVPHPYPKLDLVAVPEFTLGAMENAGLVTFRDDLLLLNPHEPAFTARRGLANVTAHEMAHMWFGNLVTIAWWDDLWLSESFADWICAKIVAETNPEYRIEFAMLAGIHNAMLTDALPSVRAIRRPVTARDDPQLLLDGAITYSKGKAILRMVETWIGPEKFRVALRGYFAKHRWGNATAHDLWAAFASGSGDDISALLTGFVEHPGVPFVTIEALPDGRARLTQRRFTNLGETVAAGRWQVPMQLQWSTGGRVHRKRVLLQDESMTLDLPGFAEADWFHPNAGESGYYRWSLPPALTSRLLQHRNRLTGLERFGMVDNAVALLNAGQLPGDEFLRTILAFVADPETEVVLKAMALLGMVRETLVGEEQRPAIDALTRVLLRPVLSRIGLKPAVGEPIHLAPLRAAVLRRLGREGADSEVVAWARGVTTEFLLQPESFDPSLAGVALAVAAYHGDADMFALFQTALEKAATPSARALLIGALGDFHQPALATRALEFSLGPALNSTEFSRVAFGLSADHRTRVVEWAMARFDIIKAKAPAQNLADIIGLADGDDPELFEKLRRFVLDPVRTSQLAEKNAGRAADRVALRARLRERASARIGTFLAANPTGIP